ncbi:TetR/AcrR family transcriptional regulator [Bacillus benzoevorans]|uniref:AcrR family transcriptional regulator n=1 Tax=Bacillus benzoevorans TaxID=1456 RepID=A0A7X0LWU6_9BACI|nr:TetR family transcriptional regulator [Bacillus benzoevorans]MBB6447103.1 AcrR family transcriptional regulator [Bacillus benzoevorans]
MPKQTFFNLPEQKRKILMEAAEKEFTRVPIFEASIANIIKMANIPRGSFYQYFADKEDLYFYLLDEKLKEGREDFIVLLKKHKGDIIDALTEMYNRFLVKLPDEEEHNFLKNAFLYATHKVEHSLMDFFDFTLNNERFKEITGLIDKQRFTIEEDKDLYHILQIVTAVAFRNFIEKISKKMSDEEAMKHFTFEIDLIKYGIYKRDQ